MSYTGSKGFSAQGTVLAYSLTESPLAYTQVAELKTINLGGIKLDSTDVTNMESLNATKEKIPTLIDPGDISLAGNYIPHSQSQQALLAALQNRSIIPWQITLPPASISGAGDTNPAQLSFNGFMTELAIDLDVTKEATFSAKIQITGVIAFIDEH